MMLASDTQLHHAPRYRARQLDQAAKPPPPNSLDHESIEGALADERRRSNCSPVLRGLLSARAGEGFHPGRLPIGPLRRFRVLDEERIVLASALMAHLRKRTNAQRLGLSTCKAGALPTELRPRALMSINMLSKTRKKTDV